MAQLLYAIGGFAARRSWTVIVLWLAALIALGGAFAAFRGELSDDITIPGTKAQQLQEELSEQFDLNANSGMGQVILQNDDDQPITGEQQSAVAAALADVDGIEGVESTMDPFETRQQQEDGQAQLDEALPQLEAAASQLDDGQSQLDDARENLPDDAPASATDELDSRQQELDQGREELQAQRAELDLNSELLSLTSGYSSVSDNGSTAIASVTFEGEISSVSPETLAEVREAFTDADLDGLSIQFDQNLEGFSEVGLAAEAIGVVVALIILFIMMGTFVAAGLPILMAFVGVGAAMLGAFALSSLVEMNSTTPALGSMLGLAVGIDYSLFILNRHRNNLAQGMEIRRSIALATGTSGNAVVFAGVTVMIALLALNVVGIPFLSVMGNVAALSVLLAVLVAVTLTPAFLGLMGRRAVPRKRWEIIQRRNRLREENRRLDPASAHALDDRAHRAARIHESTPHGWLKVVLKKPVLTVLAAAVALAIVAVPMTQLRLGLPDATSESPDSGAYKTYQIIAEEFGEGRNGPMVAAAYLPDGTDGQAAQRLQVEVGQDLLEQPDVESVVPAAISADDSMLMFQIVPVGGPNAESTTDLVESLRDLTLETSAGEVSFGVTGQAAMNIDISQNLSDVLPVYLGIVIGLSFVVLILVFRSILVPLTATLGFLFSLLAAFGATVAVFQWGWLGSLFNVTEPGPILSFLPILAVGILFGLAMDYQVFLVSGMREAFSHGRSGRKSVIVGFNHSARVVLAAALIMAGVFLGFVFSGDAMIASIGFALAAGVLLDAVVVRMTLIPALMYLMGDKAWWIPRWLDRLLPDVDVEGASLERAVQGADAEGSGSGAESGSESDSDDAGEARRAAPADERRSSVSV